MEEKTYNELKESIEFYINTMHEELGWFNEEEIKNTPRRIADFIKEWKDSNDFHFTTFDLKGKETMVVVNDVDFYSMCSHHFLPFFGKCSIAYLPKKRVCGLSKLPRTVKHFASKPQTQEELTDQITQYIFDQLDPYFVMVRMSGQHLCMMIRGIKQPNSVTVTSSIRFDPEFEPKLQHLKEEAMDMFNI